MTSAPRHRRDRRHRPRIRPTARRPRPRPRPGGPQQAGSTPWPRSCGRRTTSRSRSWSPIWSPRAVRDGGGAPGRPRPPDRAVGQQRRLRAQARFLDNTIEDEEAHLDVLVTAVMRLSHAALGPWPDAARGGSSTSRRWRRSCRVAPTRRRGWVNSFSEWAHNEYTPTGRDRDGAVPRLHQDRVPPADGGQRGDSFMWLEPEFLVKTALADFDKGRVYSVPGAQYKAIRSLTRVIPSVGAAALPVDGAEVGVRRRNRDARHTRPIDHQASSGTAGIPRASLIQSSSAAIAETARSLRRAKPRATEVLPFIDVGARAPPPGQFGGNALRSPDGPRSRSSRSSTAAVDEQSDRSKRSGRKVSTSRCSARRRRGHQRRRRMGKLRRRLRSRMRGRERRHGQRRSQRGCAQPRHSAAAELRCIRKSSRVRPECWSDVIHDRRDRRVRVDPAIAGSRGASHASTAPDMQSGIKSSGGSQNGSPSAPIQATRQPDSIKVPNVALSAASISAGAGQMTIGTSHISTSQASPCRVKSVGSGCAIQASAGKLAVLGPPDRRRP